MKGIMEYTEHFHAWAGIQRTRHEHRCAATQPYVQAFNATVLKLHSPLLHIMEPSIFLKTMATILCYGVFCNVFVPALLCSISDSTSTAGLHGLAG
jgi:hypothetical protein